MISVNNISKTFKLYRSPSDRLKEIILRRRYHKDFHALKNISFEVPEGETLGIVGQNGAGKSTILKILTGVLLPDEGSVQVSGKITGLLELGTGFNAEFSGMDNIFLNGTYLGLSHREMEERLDKIVDFTELKDFIHEPIKTYSSGMLMRLAFSIAIHADPICFVVDEALSVGDAYFSQKCMKKIKEFRNSGGSIVFVSHDLNAVKILCDQAILLENGIAVDQGSPEAIINMYSFLISKRTAGEEIRFQENDEMTGYGNNKVTIDEVKLYNENGHNTNKLLSGHPVRVQIRVTGREDAEEVIIGIVIRDKFGQDIFGTNSYYHDIPMTLKKGDSRLMIFQFDEFNIGPGKYSVSVAAHRGETHIEECFNWIDKSVSFEVINGGVYQFVGINLLKPVLHIE